MRQPNGNIDVPASAPLVAAEADYASLSAPRPVASLDGDTESIRRSALRVINPIHREVIREANMTIVGTGTIGDKARELLTKSPILQELGFCVPPRIVIANDLLEMIVRDSGLTGFDDTSLSMNDHRFAFHLNPHISTLLESLSSLQPGPVAVRSSAESDARGTGTYDSVFCTFDPQFPGKFIEAFEHVLRSYFTSDAIDYRRDTQAPQGYAIIIEPIIGELFQRRFAPLISGCGYSSTPQGEGYLSFVPGLGGGVSAMGAENIQASTIHRYHTLLAYLIDEYRNILHQSTDGNQPRFSQILRTFDPSGNILMPLQNPHGQAFNIETGCPTEQPVAIRKGAMPLFSKVDIRHLFEMHQRAERTFGKPQYLEWAVTLDQNGTPQYWCTQIADADIRPDVALEHPGTLLYEGHSVVGTGIKESDTVVIVPAHATPSDILEINQCHENYILFFPRNMMHTNADNQPTYHMISNASAVIEYGDDQHCTSPYEHWKGLLDSTGKLFAVLDTKKGPSLGHADRVHVETGKFRVASSARQNRLVIYRES